MPTPISRWTARAIFWLNILYLFLLALLLVSRPAHWLQIDRIPDPIGGWLPLGVLWFGALGAVTISTYGVFDHNHAWDTRWNYWHILRPVMGAILGAVAFMIFVGLINATGNSATITTVSDTKNGGLAYFVLAFVVGFREETFRSLIKRAADILLGPGIPGATPASVSLSADNTDLGTLTVGTPKTVSIVVANTGTGVISTNPASATPPGVKISSTPAATLTDPSLAGLSINPSSNITGTLTITPLQAGAHVVSIEINGSFGTRTITLRGTAS